MMSSDEFWDGTGDIIQQPARGGLLKAEDEVFGSGLHADRHLALCHVADNRCFQHLALGQDHKQGARLGFLPEPFQPVSQEDRPVLHLVDQAGDTRRGSLLQGRLAVDAVLAQQRERFRVRRVAHVLSDERAGHCGEDKMAQEFFPVSSGEARAELVVLARLQESLDRG